MHWWLKPFICLTFLIRFFFPFYFAWADGSSPHEIWVLVDLWKRRLFVMEGNHVKAEFIIGIGKKRTPTPIGDWIITDKSKDWGGGFGSRWLGLNVPWGRFGIHGTNKPYSVGTRASHGCIRLLNPDIVRLYDLVPIGSKVKIVGPILGLDEHHISRLVRGKKGTLVQLVQNRLTYAGYYHGEIDGIFGKELEKAILRFQKDYGLERSGQIGEQEYLVLGLLE